MRFNIQIFGAETKTLVFADAYDTFEDVMSNNGINADSGFKYIVLFNGKVVNTFLTLEAIGIKEGATVVVLQKKIKNEIDILATPTQEEREAFIEENVIQETCRIADLGFSGWECDTKAPSVLMELYEAEQEILAEEERESLNFELFMHGTVVSKPTKICDKPLPRCFLCTD